MALNEEEKEKIRDEELYRYEIRRREELRNPKKRGLVPFLNSNLGILLLSSFFVTGGGILYEYYSEVKKENARIMDKEKNRLHEESKLKDEILYRFKVLQTVNDTLKPYERSDIYLVLQGSIIKDSKKLNIEYYNYIPLYEEFTNWTLIRLLREYENTEDDSKLVADIKEIRVLLEKCWNDLTQLSENFYPLTTDGKILPRQTKLKVWKDPRQKNYLNLWYFVNNGEKIFLKRGERFKYNLYKLDTNENVEGLVQRVRGFIEKLR